MATAYREGRPRTSVAWDHFEIKNREKGVATCNICQDAFSYRSSVSNLMKHLRNRHGYSVVKGDDEDENGQGENGGNDEKCLEPKIKTELWEYYEVKDEENKQATCTICLEQYSFAKSLEELFGHLKSKHSIDFGKEAEKSDDEVTAAEDDDEFVIQTISEHKVRTKSSVAWDYFEVKDEEKKVASCLTCGALCSYKSSVSNLMKHARRKHGVKIEVTDEENVIESLDAVTEIANVAHSKIFTDSRRAQRSIVWLYFKCIDSENKVSKCLLCHKTLSHSSTLTNLKKHLARKHPNVKIPVREDGKKRILLSSGGELYEVETTEKLDVDEDDDNNQNDTLEMDTVFLEDFDTLQQETSKKTPKIPSTTRKRSYSSSSEEEITFVNRYKKKHSDSFDHFGRYLASLLRNLPKETASKLQVDFLKQVMDVEKDGFEDADLTALFAEEDEEDSFRCLLCRAVVTGDQNDLRAHLSDRHSDKLPESEEDDENDVFTEVVYLDDEKPRTDDIKKRKIGEHFIGAETYNDYEEEIEYISDSERNLNVIEKNAIPEKQNSKKHCNVYAKTEDHEKYSSLNTENAAGLKTDLNDELEKFGSYVASLLRTFPKKVCMKLQMKIVNQIMEEKLKLDDDDDVGGSSENVTVSKELVREFTKSVSELE